MRKYVLTEENMPMVAGLIRKFLQSCNSKCHTLVDWNTVGKLSKVSKHRSGCYYSMAGASNVKYVKCREVTAEELEAYKHSIFRDETKPLPTHIPSHIAISNPVRTSYTIGDIIYFVGGNRIIFQNGRYKESLNFYDRDVCRRYLESK